MENDEDNNIVATGTENNNSQCAVNSLILDYYKKFGRKRDLEQFFSLSTAQGEIKDTSGLFWRKMKSENDSSDSGGRKSESSAQELCRISIRCSMPEGSSSQSDDPKTKAESPQTDSPPIITEDAPTDMYRQTDDESFKSDDNHSQKSFDPLLDLSAHKPLSPSSSITSQRKLEWDSLADVGYANESDRKTSGSSLSTLERLALKQQYTNNDTNQEIGNPTCHSTPVEEKEGKSKMKKSGARKVTKIVKKDVDFVEVNVPHTSDINPRQSINVNLTKHISFNVEKDGAISFDNMRKDVNISPEKVTIDEASCLPMHKEIQTSLPKTKDKSCSSVEEQRPIDLNSQKIPVMISLNTLRKRLRQRKTRIAKRRQRTKKKTTKNIPQEKTGEQLSEAESFEYMPGHIYNQNQMKANENNEPRPEHNTTAGNKSSLESSGGLTTDSSKGSKHSLTQDLEKCIKVLKVTLQKRYDDSETKTKLIKEIVQRLLSSKYRDDDTSTDFLSGLSFNSKKLGLKENNTTTSTSDANNTDDSKEKRPRKSILRTENFDSNMVASTSQSAPNLFTATNTEKVYSKSHKVVTSYTESDESSKCKTSSDNAPPKTSSEELYLKYLEALRREESYKRHLRDKEMFLKQKLGNSEAVPKAPNRQEAKINNRLKDLMKDLTRNNYDDGSGDASKLEGGSTSDRNVEHYIGGSRSQRSHSVFTLSSSQSDHQKKPNLKKKMQVDKDLDAGSSKNHYCCCPHHFVDSKAAYTDSSVQVNIKYQYEDEPNAKVNQDQSAKCPYCEKNLYSTKDEKCKCNEKLKPSPNTIGTCSKCGKFLKNSIPETDTYITYQKYARSPRTVRMVSNKYYDRNNFCVCDDKIMPLSNVCDYSPNESCRLPQRGIRFGDPSNIPNSSTQCEGLCKAFEDDGIRFLRAPRTDHGTDSSKSDNTSKGRKCSQSSQTNMSINLMINEKGSGSKPTNLFKGISNDLVVSEVKRNPVIIHEATRCLQTEISIDPQISDPTLSNIVIVSNCVELIGEHHREVVGSGIKNSNERKTFSDVYTSSESGKFLMRSGPSTFEEDIDSDIVISECKDGPNIEQPKKPNDYAIPIEGTNMTLVVSLASKDINRKKEQVNQAVGTEKSPIADQGTCIATECAKSAQCQATTSGNSTRSTCFNSEHNSNKCSMSGRQSPRKSCLSKPGTSTLPQRNTYPKKMMKMKLQANDRKPLQRSNTDTGKLETYSEGFQTEPFGKIDFRDLVKQSNTETATIEYCCQVPDTESDKRMLCCGNDEEELPPNTKEIGIQKDLSVCESPGRKPTPIMISKSVGIDIKTTIGDGFSKKTCLKCGTETESDCQCDKYLESKSKQTTCEGCENGDICDRNCNQKSNHDIRCELCGSNDSSCCDCRKTQETVKNIEFLVCGCETVDKCKCEKDQNCGSRKPKCMVCASDNCQCEEKQILREIVSKKSICEKCGSEDSCQCDSDINDVKDPIIDMIKDITRRYSKNEINKIKKKKRLSEIMSVLNYLLETDDSTDQEPRRVSITTEYSDSCDKKSARSKSPISDDKNAKIHPLSSKSIIDKNANIRFHQSPGTPKRSPRVVKKCSRSKSPMCCNNSKKNLGSCANESCSCNLSKHSALTSKCTTKDCTESSDLPCSTDLPSTSDSTACRILRKIKRECEKYHLRRNKCGRKCDISSSTSINCDQCKKVHHCGCRHKCKRSRTVEKLQKKCVAYNLILQTSESMLSEGAVCEKSRPLKNVVVKVPKNKDKCRKETCKETVYNVDIGHKTHCSPRGQRSKSCPKESEMSSTDDFIRRTHHCTIREYLEKNRPDFVEKCSERQSCLKYINEMRANERAAHRDMLSLHVHKQPDLTSLSAEQLRELAQQIGLDMRRKKVAPKFISEREMKKHSRNIYKTLPEVVQKKEEKKKENIKKTNLLMANIFKKNLQKNTLRGTVNLSNYNSVIKI